MVKIDTSMCVKTQEEVNQILEDFKNAYIHYLLKEQEQEKNKAED